MEDDYVYDSVDEESEVDDPESDEESEVDDAPGFDIEINDAEDDSSLAPDGVKTEPCESDGTTLDVQKDDDVEHESL